MSSTGNNPLTQADARELFSHLSNLCNNIASCGDRLLLNDAEAAARLGYRGPNPTAYMLWLRDHCGLKSVKLRKLRRWRKTDLDAFVENLPEIVNTRKPRTKKTA